jgi:hypothetical protein
MDSTWPSATLDRVQHICEIQHAIGVSVKYLCDCVQSFSFNSCQAKLYSGLGLSSSFSFQSDYITSLPLFFLFLFFSTDTATPLSCCWTTDTVILDTRQWHLYYYTVGPVAMFTSHDFVLFLWKLVRHCYLAKPMSHWPNPHLASYQQIGWQLQP